jgi:hypothetical protein
MIFKLARAAEKTWRRLDGNNLPKVGTRRSRHVSAERALLPSGEKVAS